MAWPPATIAADKGDGTTMATDHPAHHNALAAAINDLADELPLGGWVSFTPSWTNITVGSSTSTGRLFRVGNLVLFSASIVSAASFAITGTPRLALPSTAAAAPLLSDITVSIHRVTGGAAMFKALMDNTNLSTTSTGDFHAEKADGTYVYTAAISSTVPFNWGTSGDKIHVSGCYMES